MCDSQSQDLLTVDRGCCALCRADQSIERHTERGPLRGLRHVPFLAWLWPHVVSNPPQVAPVR